MLQLESADRRVPTLSDYNFYQSPLIIPFLNDPPAEINLVWHLVNINNNNNIHYKNNTLSVNCIQTRTNNYQVNTNWLYQATEYCQQNLSINPVYTQFQLHSLFTFRNLCSLEFLLRHYYLQNFHPFRIETATRPLPLFLFPEKIISPGFLPFPLLPCLNVYRDTAWRGKNWNVSPGNPWFRR